MNTIKPSFIIASIIACSYFAAASSAATRLSAYGSNPYVSWAMFPQDIQRWQSNYVAFAPSYEQLPYWGSIDQPLKKPNGTYTSTGYELVKGDTGFSHSSKIHSLVNDYSYTYRFLPDVIADLNLDYDVEVRSTVANGVLHDDANNLISFDYSHAHTLNQLTLQGMLAFEAFGIPSGLRLKAGFKNTLLYNQGFTFNRQGIEYSTERATWGWTSSPCAHIFGNRGVQGDSWLQSGYARGPVYEVDLQGGVTLPIARIGGRFALIAGHQDYYSWHTDSSGFSANPADSSINRNFVGSYQKEDWASVTQDALGQLYSNITLLKSDRFSLNSFVLLGYDGVTQGQALSSNLDVAGSAKDKTHGFSIEAAPNLLIPSGTIFSYIDVALQAEYGYTRFNNTALRWVGGGQIEKYQDSYTDDADEVAWQGFSYANRNIANFGIDLSTMFPLLASEPHSIGLGFQLLLDSKFTFMTKYYGSNIEQGTDVNFEVSKMREDYERNVQFATGLKLQYQGRPFLAWLEVTEPLLNSLLPRTRVVDANTRAVLYEHEKSPLWMSLEGIWFGLYVSYEMTLPFLQSNRSAPEFTTP